VRNRRSTDRSDAEQKTKIPMVKKVTEEVQKTKKGKVGPGNSGERKRTVDREMKKREKGNRTRERGEEGEGGGVLAMGVAGDRGKRCEG